MLLRTSSLIWCLLAAACGGEGPAAPDAPAAADAAIDAPPPSVTCGQAFPGPVLPTGVVEAEPGYADALAALDLTSVAYPIDLAAESTITRAVVNYTLGVVGQTSITEAQVIAAGPLGDAVRGAVAITGDNSVDLRFLRRGLHHFTPCARALPPDLDALRARYGDWTTWPSTTVPCAAPKNGPRRIFERPDGMVFLSQTLVGDAVRETEVIMLDGRTDGQLDFAAYTDQGALTDRSTFATASSSTVVASPYGCMACHYDTAAQRYTDIAPTGTGAGCNVARTSPHGLASFEAHMRAR